MTATKPRYASDLVCVHGYWLGRCPYCPSRLPMKCEACTDGMHEGCNRASWCQCECEGMVEAGDIGPEESPV